jgi:hypothetical protein
MPHHLQQVFVSLQARLETNLRVGQNVLKHPVAKGDATEANWINAMKEHLPHRYQVSKAFVIDADGNESEQIDLVIYDRQYTPILYNRDEQRLIPAESVYAIFEVRPSLNRENIIYAGEKVASVRALNRTSVGITYAAGKYEPRPLFPIIGGILCYDSGWKPAFGDPLIAILGELDEIARIDLGCVVTEGAFESSYEKGKVGIICSDSRLALANFLFSLLAKLQGLGTVPAINYASYIKSIDSDL